MLLMVTGSSVKRLLDKSLSETSVNARTVHAHWDRTNSEVKAVSEPIESGSFSSRLLDAILWNPTRERRATVYIVAKHHAQTEYPIWKENQSTQEVPSGCFCAGSLDLFENQLRWML